jgi:hypothetical protein
VATLLSGEVGRSKVGSRDVEEAQRNSTAQASVKFLYEKYNDLSFYQRVDWPENPPIHSRISHVDKSARRSGDG